MGELHDIDWNTIEEGVEAARISFADPDTCVLSTGARDMLWFTTDNGSIQCQILQGGSISKLNRHESSILFWPRGDWNVAITAVGDTTLNVIKISLSALHRILAVEFADQRDQDERFDYRQLSRTVQFSPVRARDFSRLYVRRHSSLFGSISRRGIFLDLFAEMLEMLYGTDVNQCPFNIDSDTEQKIRSARQILVENLQDTPDLEEIAYDVDLPRQVLKEGFTYIYGKSMPSYLSDFKFEQARVMLESGKYLIKEVAFAMGYQNPSHFISAFKQRYGTTPKQWLKQQSLSDSKRDI